MNASEKLSFIRPFEVSEKAELTEETSRKEVGEKFIDSCSMLLKKYPENIIHEEIVRNGVSFGVFESSLIVKADDGTYLHIVVYGHTDEMGILDFGISIDEHLGDGELRGGYMYACGSEGVSRQWVAAEENEEGELNKTHFSLIEQYHFYDELTEAQHSGDIDACLSAMEEILQLEQKTTRDVWEKEVESAVTQPDIKEVLDLTLLLKYAEPFASPSTVTDEL